MSLRGFRWVLIFTSVGLAIPLIPFLGTPVGWGLLPFLVGALDVPLRLCGSWDGGEREQGDHDQRNEGPKPAPAAGPATT